MNSGVYGFRENKFIPWRVVYIAQGELVHPMESVAYSTWEIKSIL
jgi:hypothetical protein